MSSRKGKRIARPVCGVMRYRPKLRIAALVAADALATNKTSYDPQHKERQLVVLSGIQFGTELFLEIDEDMKCSNAR